MGKRKDISGYKSMWLFVTFDVPVDTPRARRAYRELRKTLLDKGFSQLQYSVYARFFGSEERAQPYRQVVRLAVPEDGRVRMFSLTDTQFARMESYYGEKRARVEKKPAQMLLF